MNATMCLSLIAGASVAFTAAAETTPFSNDEARAITAEMLGDQSTNSAFASHAGWNENTTGPEITGGFQFRYILNFRDDNDDDAGDGFDGENDFDNGFQFGSNVINLDGEVGNGERFGYHLRGQFDFDGGNFFLEDLYFTYDFGNNWMFMGGQMKVPFLREELVDDFFQLAVDRSILNEAVNPNRTQGVALHYQDDNLRFWGVFSDGSLSGNTGFLNDASSNGGTTFPGFSGGESEAAITLRGEYKGSGTWDQFNDFSGAVGDEFAWLVGGAVHWEFGEDDDTDEDYNALGWTLDVSVEGNGWNAFAAYIGLYNDFDEAGFDSVTDNGFVVQGGWFIPDSNWELFGRYSVIIPDSERANDDTFSAITFGANHYIHGHAAKLTIDAVLAIDEATGNDLVPNGGIQKIGFAGDDDGTEWSIRGQFQLLY